MNLRKNLLLAMIYLRGAKAITRKNSFLFLIKPIVGVWFGFNKFTRNLIVGLVATIGLSLTHNAQLLKDFEDSGFDLMLNVFKGVVNVNEGSGLIRPITFIDIDDVAYRKWDEPVVTPRNKIAKLIDYSVTNGAFLIVVDVELSQTTKLDEDRELIEVLNKINTSTNEVKIVFSRGLRRIKRNDGNYVFETKKSFIDREILNSKKIYWAAPLFQIDDDSIIRRWKLWQSLYREDANGDIKLAGSIPSFQLISAVIIEDQLKSNGVDYINNLNVSLSNLVNSEKSNLNSKHFLFGKEIDLIASGLPERIFYSLPYNENKNYPTMRWMGNDNYPLLTIRPAYTITENLNLMADTTEKNMVGHTVFIGASYFESRDIFQTPIGQMPGTMIVVNSYLSILQHALAKEPSTYQLWIGKVFFIVLISFIFSIANSFIAKVVANVVVVSLLIPIALFLFWHGVWVDFALPLILVEIYSSFSGIEIRLRRIN